MADSAWNALNPFNQIGLVTQQAPAHAASVGIPGIARSGGPSAADAGAEKPWHPDSPLFWFGVVLAATLGLIGAATSVRVGPIKASTSVGKS